MFSDSLLVPGSVRSLLGHKDCDRLPDGGGRKSFSTVPEKCEGSKSLDLMSSLLKGVNLRLCRGSRASRD